jgi:excinuclease ABC subunit A
MTVDKSLKNGPIARAAATEIQGARMHNLRGVDCNIPLSQITVITGVSGSGKSTLAFDVLYAEGQRRFVECLGSYARQFLERLERPTVDKIGYLQPPIALKQHVSVKNARSTVGSITELSDHLRLLFANAGEMHCTHCGGRVLHTGTENALKAIELLPAGMRLVIVAPLPGKPDKSLLDGLELQGFVRLFVGNEVVYIDEFMASDQWRKKPKGDFGVVVDRIITGKADRNRMAESLRTAWQLGQRVCVIHALSSSKPEPPTEGASQLDNWLLPSLPIHLRQGTVCCDCGKSGIKPSAALFSWNSPIGACEACNGFGRLITIDRDKVVPNRGKSLRNNAVAPFGVPSAKKWYRWLLSRAEELDVPTGIPFRDLTTDQQEWVYAGDDDYPGVSGFFEQLEKKRYKMHVRIFIARFRGYQPCTSCHGGRLRPEALAVTLPTTGDAKNIQAIHEMPVTDLKQYLSRLDSGESKRKGVDQVCANILERLDYLIEVGVGYLSLGRSGRTLSGGESQRIRLAAALGSSLTETLYILDEPTVGLHASDSIRMLQVMRRLTEMGNTVVVVEHDPAIISGADHLIVLGPGGGRQGGRIVHEGAVAPFLRRDPLFFFAQAPSPETVPGGGGPRKKRLANPWNETAFADWKKPVAARETPGGHRLVIGGATENNLRIKRLEIPLARMVVISGVSGSGKSTLLDRIIYKHWQRRQGTPTEDVGAADEVSGFEAFNDVHFVGQQLPGRSSRSNPVSYIKAFAEIRQLYADTFMARQRSLKAGHFSFNTTGGRCETCKGMGSQVLEMYFLPDVEVPCEDCGGDRFRSEVLEVTYRKKTIAQVLNMTVDEGIAFFRAEPKVAARLNPLKEVGLGYLILGQSTATLSGGEAQRLRLAAFLARGHDDQRHLFLFDEPTTGLHGKDVSQLLRAMRRLTAMGHGVIIVEHHLDLIGAADWVIDLGPGAGDLGGQVVFSGTVKQLLTQNCTTASALRAHGERIAELKQMGNETGH